MSRLPRHLEHLKTAFTAEAVAAARYRAFADQAERDGLPNLARHWLALAAAKDALAVAQLTHAGQAHGPSADLGAAIAEESYENEVLYPKMIRDVDAETANVLSSTVAAQQEHLARLIKLRDAYSSSQGDVPSPP